MGKIVSETEREQVCEDEKEEERCETGDREGGTGCGAARQQGGATPRESDKQVPLLGCKRDYSLSLSLSLSLSHTHTHTHTHDQHTHWTRDDSSLRVATLRLSYRAAPARDPAA
jgi:hypothetical protein